MGLDSKDREIQCLKLALRESRTRGFALTKALTKKNHSLKKLNRDLDRVVQLFNRACDGADQMFRSSRWRLGTILCKNKTYAPLQKPIGEFRKWQSHSRGQSYDLSCAEAKDETAEIFAEIMRPAIDVVICVHNALEFVKDCVESVVNCSPRMRKLILVNDGSDETTSRWLEEFIVSAEIPIQLIRNVEGRGYTLAANQGMRQSDAEYVVLLNSDTIVPSNWLDTLIACGESNENIGIIGPLSNAASWQSVPERFDGDDWAVNDLPEGMSVDQFASRLQMEHSPAYPHVPLINGFCLVIKRKVFKKIGYFDEENFPVGYGEENDFCLRASRAGFTLAIADNAYIFHAKSRSFTHERRRLLSKDANKVLFGLHSEEVLSKACIRLNENEELEQARLVATTVASKTPVFKILYLLPFAGTGGGTHSVVQEASGLRKRGVFSQIAIKFSDLGFYLERYPDIDKSIFFLYGDDFELVKYAHSFDVVIATLNTTIDSLNRIHLASPEVIPAYYVQDYEPLFYEKGTEHYLSAFSSYNKIPEAVLFAKTSWIINEVNRHHHVKVHKIIPSIDHEIYYHLDEDRHQKKVICAMIRPVTPRRSPELTTKVLQQLRLKYGDSVEVVAFGCDDDDQFWHEHHFTGKKAGVLTRGEVAGLLRRAWLFLDLSTYQAFGRTGLEAMACGCATILPRIGGTEEYAVDGKNCLLIEADKEEEILTAAERLIEDETLHANIVKGSLETASRYGIDQAAESIQALFQEESIKRKMMLNTDKNK